jgi:hypothetical protein
VVRQSTPSQHINAALYPEGAVEPHSLVLPSRSKATYPDKVCA